MSLAVSGDRWLPRPAPAAGRLTPLAAASVLLHGTALAGLFLLVQPEEPPPPAPEQGVEMVWQPNVQQASLVEDQPAEAETPPPAPAPPPPEVAPEVTQPPPPMALAPLQPAPPLTQEAPPATRPDDVVLPPPSPPEPAPAAEVAPPAEPGLALPLPPPPTPVPPTPRPEPPRQQAQPAPRQAAPPAAEGQPRPKQAEGALAEAPRPAPEGGAMVQGATTPPSALPNWRNAEPEYPPFSREAGHQGSVRMRLHVSESGRVVAVEILTSSGHRALDDAARRAVMRWRYQPAMRDGQPIPGTLTTNIHFQLTGGFGGGGW